MNANEIVESKGTLVGQGDETQFNRCEEPCEEPLQTKNSSTIRPCYPVSGYAPQGNETSIQKDTSTLFMALFTVAKMSNLGAVQGMTGLYSTVSKHT